MWPSIVFVLKMAVSLSIATEFIGKLTTFPTKRMGLDPSKLLIYDYVLMIPRTIWQLGVYIYPSQKCFGAIIVKIN
jgi:hypothetical protein